MKRLVLLMILIMTLCVANAYAQEDTRLVNFTEIMKTGVESQYEWKTELTYINRRSTGYSIPFTQFPLSFSNTNDTASSGGDNNSALFGVMKGNGNIVFNLSHILSSSQFVIGDLEIHGSETYSPRFGKYLSNVEAQVILKKFDAQNNLVSATFTTPGQGTVGNDPQTNFMMQALWWTQNTSIPANETGFRITSDGPVFMTIKLYDLFAFGESPYSVVGLTLKPNKEYWLSDIFPNLPITEPISGGFGRVTDGNIEIFADRPVIITGFRREGLLQYDIPAFIGRQAFDPVDMITIITAKQKPTGKLVIEATSSDSTAQLFVSVVFIDGTTKDLGLLRPKFKNLAPVYSVTLRSSSGGTITRIL